MISRDMVNRHSQFSSYLTVLIQYHKIITKCDAVVQAVISRTPELRRYIVAAISRTVQQIIFLGPFNVVTSAWSLFWYVCTTP